MHRQHDTAWIAAVNVNFDARNVFSVVADGKRNKARTTDLVAGRRDFLINAFAAFHQLAFQRVDNAVAVRIDRRGATANFYAVVNIVTVAVKVVCIRA